MAIELQRQQLAAAITALRASRDSAARAASALRDHGAFTLADTLDVLAADQDKQLAGLLEEDAKLTDL